MAVGPNGNGSSEAAHGVPLLMSLPHYCLVDETVTAALEGMLCDPPRHGIFLDVEPTTGVTMRAAKRLQLSSQLTTSARSTLEPFIRNSLILPIFWAEEASQVSGVQAALFRSSVYTAQHIVTAVRTWSYPAAAAAMALAVLALSVAGVLGAQQRRRPQRPASLSAGNTDGIDTNGARRDAIRPFAPVPPPPTSAQTVVASSSAMGMRSAALAPAAADSAGEITMDVREDGEGFGLVRD
ncbi:hypothetical protein Vretifemale_15338 [Volvox reticuliferus]|nr:hypothetical protein Vretifemale_15338 [Volvox reticuliferus]